MHVRALNSSPHSPDEDSRPEVCDSSEAPPPSALPPALLYVEDEENDVLFMRRAINRAGVALRFRSVCDGDKAVDCLASEAPPDLVLLDLNLPARSGFEVLDWIRAQPRLRALPVVILSSSGRIEDRERARSLGADDYVIKPSSPLRLVDTIGELWQHWLVPRRRSTIAATTPPQVVSGK